LAAAELAAFVLTNAAQTPSPCRCCRPSAFGGGGSTGIPKNARAALPKIDIRSKTGRIIHYYHIYILRVAWHGYERGVAQAERAWFAG